MDEWEEIRIRRIFQQNPELERQISSLLRDFRTRAEAAYESPPQTASELIDRMLRVIAADARRALSNPAAEGALQLFGELCLALVMLREEMEGESKERSATQPDDKTA